MRSAPSLTPLPQSATPHWPRAEHGASVTEGHVQMPIPRVPPLREKPLTWVASVTFGLLRGHLPLRPEPPNGPEMGVRGRLACDAHRLARR